MPPTFTTTRPALGNGVLDAVGRTPLVRLERLLGTDLPVWAKLEGCNPGGSAKARPAKRMITEALADGRLQPGGTVIESSSGNMGVGLAQACALAGLRLICVVDSRATEANLRMIRVLGAETVIVEPRAGEDHLEARLRVVGELQAETPNSFWTDQYSNPANPASHSSGTMREIDEALDGRVDVVLVASSTGGTLRGCLDYVAENSRGTRVIAVDAEGSVLFGGRRGPRRLPGMGAGTNTPHAQRCGNVEVIRVDELECVVGCRRLARREAIVAGASSGGVAAALRRLAPELAPRTRCALVLADNGGGYMDTVYDDGWVERELGVGPQRLAELVDPESA